MNKPCFLKVVSSGLGGFFAHNQPVVAPAQFATQRVANCLIRIGQVELPEVAQMMY
jgi:hypothetical protein